MSAIKAWVINLERSVDRRRHMERQIEEHLPLVEHEFVSAVDGRLLTPDERRSYVDEEAVRQAPNWLSPGMIGCALSHLTTYERIVSSPHRLALVLEDDVILPGDLMTLLDEAASHLRDLEVLLLHFRSFEPCRFSRASAVALSGGRYLAEPLDLTQPVSTAAYIIGREAARRLADVVPPVRVSPDSWKYLRDAGGFTSLRCVVPCPVAVTSTFRTTLDHTPVGTVRSRFVDLVSRHRIPPFAQGMRLYRAYRLHRWNRFAFDDDAS